MEKIGLYVVCSIPAIIGVCAIVYALIESAVKEPLCETILLVPVYDANTPVSEMLRVIQYNSFGHKTVVVDMNNTIEGAELLVRDDLCDEVIKPEQMAETITKFTAEHDKQE